MEACLAGTTAHPTLVVVLVLVLEIENGIIQYKYISQTNLLLSIMGIHSGYRPMPRGIKSLGLARWAYYCAREAVAILVDTTILLFFKILPKA